MQNAATNRPSGFRHKLAATVFGMAFTAVAATSALATPIIGLVGPSTLIGFDSASSTTVTSTLNVTGLGGENIRGIDFRPATGQLLIAG